MPKNLLCALISMLLAAGCVRASNAANTTNAPTGSNGVIATLDVESLPRKKITLPNGISVAVVTYEGQNWTEIDPASVLSARETTLAGVCFEGKFEAYVGQTGFKLVGVEGKLLFEDVVRRKQATPMKPMDNVWVCGTLQQAKNGHGQDLMIYDVASLPQDAQRFENRFGKLETARDVPGLVDLGHRIDLSIKNSKNSNFVGMTGFERMGQLRDKSWALAIAIKREDLRPNDDKGCYEIATMYRDLLGNNTQFNSQFKLWVQKTLEINPDHGNASKDAEQLLSLVRVGDKYVTKSDYEELQKKMEQSQRESAELQKERELERNKRRKAEIAGRTVRLLEYQSALCTSEPKRREGAIKSLGEEIQKSLDEAFAFAAVDILTNMNDVKAIRPGLESAAKSEFVEVRQLVYASLAWRAVQNDGNSETAFRVLTSALKTETLKEPAQEAARALARSGSKNAVATLIAALDSPEPAVCDALMDGLKIITHNTLQKKEEWRAWWKENEHSFPEAGIESAVLK